MPFRCNFSSAYFFGSVGAQLAVKASPCKPPCCQIGFDAISLFGKMPVSTMFSFPTFTRRVSFGEMLSTPGIVEVTNLSI